MANLFAVNNPFSIKSCGKSNLIGASNDLATVTITKIIKRIYYINQIKKNNQSTIRSKYPKDVINKKTTK